MWKARSELNDAIGIAFFGAIIDQDQARRSIRVAIDVRCQPAARAGGLQDDEIALSKNPTQAFADDRIPAKK